MDDEQAVTESDPDNSDSYDATPRPNVHLGIDTEDNDSTRIDNEISAVDETKKEEIVIVDAAVNICDSGASRTSSAASNEPPRLLILSNRVKVSHVMMAALLPNVKLVTFKHDQCDLDGILSTVATSVSSQKFESIALIFNCSSLATITLCGLDEKLLSPETVIEMTSVREFFAALANNHIDTSWVNARVDLLLCSAASTVEGKTIANEIADITKVPCGMSKDLLGTNIVLNRIADDAGERTVGSLYFRVDRLRPVSSKQSMSFFEKIRTVGKGAYGSAVLYRKKDDDSLVILKEINMHDLNATERQMALNEVKVLSMLEHPNIISYFDSFEEDGILMIEMDYADGGTLAQLLSKRDQPLEERRILEMFQQMVSAIKHIHGHKILHRDLKTQNIFLTKEGVIKMGDFGISKMLTTGGKGANTVVGTPYYISPEMCEGKPYGPKSDIWALGCILYEMACLEKTFEGSNLPAVVNKIMKGVYTPVKGPYSKEFKEIVERMLDRDPLKRPSSDELWTDILPSILMKYTDDRGEEADDELGNSVDSNQSKKTMSVLYYLTTQSLALTAVHVPNRIKIKEVTVGKEHAIIISQECMIFSYGRGTEGQLGHGDEKSRSTPVLIEALKGKSVNKACCGDGFSVFASNNGIVMTCGDASSGCLGQAEGQSLNKPKLIEDLLHVDVMSIACGAQHVAIVGNNGDVYTWGNGTHGKLGLGNEDSPSLPQKVSFSEPVNVKEVFCSQTGTMFLTDVGSVWACGSNKYNRLGLNNRQGFLAALKKAFNKTEVEGSKGPAVVRDLCRFIVTSISMGVNHTAVLIEGGKIITFGRNLEGQLGSGDSKPQQGLVHVKSLETVNSMQVSCTSLSTIVSIANGQILLLGSRYKLPPPADFCNWLDPSMKRQLSNEAARSRQGSASSQRSLSQTNVSSTALREAQNSLERVGSASSNKKLLSEKLASDLECDSEASTSSRRPLTAGGSQRQQSSSSTSTGSTRPLSATGPSLDQLEVQYQPAPIMNLQSEHSETVVLSCFTCHEENVFVLVETTAPPTQKKLKKRRSNQRTLGGYSNYKSSASSREALDDSEASEMDMTGTVPTWLRGELAEAPVYDKDQADGLEDADIRRVVSKPPTSPTKADKPDQKKPSGKATVFQQKVTEDLTSSSNEEDEISQPIGTAWASSTSLPLSTKPPKAPEKSKGGPKINAGVKRTEEKTDKSVARTNSLHQEIDQLKREADLRISRLEEDYSKKVDEARWQKEQEAAKKEEKLEGEVQQLRDELAAQNRQMQEKVLELQKELVKIQTQSTKPSTESNTSKQQAKSSICLIQ